MTLKQFIYLVVFFPLGYVIFQIFPIPILNFLLALAVATFGVALAFVPVNDRPLDIFIKNLIKRLTSPTQYLYRKINKPPHFLEKTQFISDPKNLSSYADSQKKLLNYLEATSQKKKHSNGEAAKLAEKKEFFDAALSKTERKPQELLLQKEEPEDVVQEKPQLIATKRSAFLTGEVKNNKQIPLEGILIYIKDDKGKLKNLLKTNPHGVFATYHRLPTGLYTVEIKDPKGAFFFDTMKITLGDENPTPLEFVSKELI